MRPASALAFAVVVTVLMGISLFAAASLMAKINDVLYPSPDVIKFMQREWR